MRIRHMAGNSNFYVLMFLGVNVYHTKKINCLIVIIELSVLVF